MNGTCISLLCSEGILQILNVLRMEHVYNNYHSRKQSSVFSPMEMCNGYSAQATGHQGNGV